MFPEEERMSARVRFSDGEEPEAQLELEPELANRLFQAPLWIQNIWSVSGFWKVESRSNPCIKPSQEVSFV